MRPCKKPLNYLTFNSFKIHYIAFQLLWCMKKLIILFLLVLPLFGFARYGWHTKDLSLYSGLRFQPNIPALLSFDLQFDESIKNCRSNGLRYWGAGINLNINEDHLQYGLKGFLSPFRRWRYTPARRVIVLPYAYCTVNRIKQLNTEGSKTSNWGIIPGLGITSRWGKSAALRSSIQLGYEINNTSPSRNWNESLALEVKIGIGISTFHFKRKSIESNS